MRKANKLSVKISLLFASLATIAFIFYEQAKLFQKSEKYESLSSLAASRLSGSCTEYDTDVRCVRKSRELRNPAETDLKTDQNSRLLVHTEFYPPLASIGFYPWDYIVEPFKLTIIEVPDELLSDGLTYAWEINDFLNLTATQFHIGPKISAVFSTPTVLYEVKLTLKDGKDVKSVYNYHMMCKYVRREIRGMTESDRRDYFYALGQLKGQRQTIPRGNSTMLPSQKTFQYMMIKHVHTLTCSPFHNGNSFFTSHAAFTMELEEAMRTVFPGASQPYWDYTIDAKMYGNDWYLDSPMFSHDWYGKATPDNPDHHVITSWLKQIELPYNWNAPVHNSYGYVANVINNNPSKFVTRTHAFCNMENRIPLPTCKEMKGCLTKRNMEDLRSCMEGELHRDLHLGIGGAWDCKVDMKEFIKKWPETSKIMGTISIQMVTISSHLYSYGYLECPAYCALDTPFEDCMCSCPSIDTSSPDFTWEKAYDILEASQVAQAFSNYMVSPKSSVLEGVIEDKETDEKKSTGDVYQKKPQFSGMSEEASQALWLFLIELGCNPGKLGTMGTSASSGDPIFWPLHPFFDRLWNYMRLNKDGEFDDFDWKWYDSGSDCEGHRSYDTLPFYSLFADFKEPVHHYSNADLVDLLDPKDEMVPYVYDNFDWFHCLD